MSRRNKRPLKKIIQAEQDALSRMESNKDLLKFIQEYDEPAREKDLLSLEAAKVFEKRPRRLDSLDGIFYDFLRRVKVSPEKKQVLENRLRAISFFSQHDANLENISDDMISTLTSLLLLQFQRGVAKGRRLALQKSKKRR